MWDRERLGPARGQQAELGEGDFKRRAEVEELEAEEKGF